MTVTDADMNRNDTPDVLQLPQFGLALQGSGYACAAWSPSVHGHDDCDRC